MFGILEMISRMNTTAGKAMAEHRQRIMEGCIAVEMELAGVQAVCNQQYTYISLYNPISPYIPSTP